jgi:putative copper export protein
MEGPAGLTGEPPILAAVLRGIAQVSLLSLAGLLVLPMLGVRSGPQRLGRLRGILAMATPLLLAVDFLLWVQHASPTGQVDSAALSAAFGTQNGLLYALRAGLAALCAWALLLARAPGLAAVFAGAAIVVSGATGHPAGMLPSVSIPAKVVHLAAAALWTGGLLALVAPGATPDDFREDAWRVSRIALYSVIAIAFTGLVVTFRFLPRVADLVTSTYGWLVLAKVAGLAILVGFGYRNRYRLMPRLAGTGEAPLRRSVSWETGLMGAVIVLAAFLAYVSPPRPTAMAGHEGHMMPATEEHQ